MSFLIRNNKGVSILESMLAVSIVMITALIVSQINSKMKNSAKVVDSEAMLCQAQLQADLEALVPISETTFAPLSVVNGEKGTVPGLVNTKDSDTQIRYDNSILSKLAPVRVNNTKIDLSKGGLYEGTSELNSVLYTHLLAKGAIPAISKLYNVSDVNEEDDICYTGKDLNSLVPNLERKFNLSNFQSRIYVNVQNKSQPISAEDICGIRPFYPLPEAPTIATKNFEFPYGVVPGGEFVVRLKGKYKTNQGQNAECEIQKTYGFPIDNAITQPEVVVSVLDVFPSKYKFNSNSEPGTKDINTFPFHFPKYNDSAKLWESGKNACSVVSEKNKTAEIDSRMGLKIKIGFPSGVSTEPGTLLVCKDNSIQMAPKWLQQKNQIKKTQIKLVDSNTANINGSDYVMQSNPEDPVARQTEIEEISYVAFNGASSNNWVPCHQVTLCGVPPKATKFEVDPNNPYNYSYTLDYESSSAVTPDYANAFYGCDVRLDVALVDATGNSTFLSRKLKPRSMGEDQFKNNYIYGDITEVYFQPDDAFNCIRYKRDIWKIFKLILGVLRFVLEWACSLATAGACDVISVATQVESVVGQAQFLMSIAQPPEGPTTPQEPTTTDTSVDSTKAAKNQLFIDYLSRKDAQVQSRMNYLEQSGSANATVAGQGGKYVAKSSNGNANDGSKICAVGYESVKGACNGTYDDLYDKAVKLMPECSIADPKCAFFTEISSMYRQGNAISASQGSINSNFSADGAVSSVGGKSYNGVAQSGGDFGNIADTTRSFSMTAAAYKAAMSTHSNTRLYLNEIVSALTYEQERLANSIEQAKKNNEISQAEYETQMAVFTQRNEEVKKQIQAINEARDKRNKEITERCKVKTDPSSCEAELQSYSTALDNKYIELSNDADFMSQYSSLSDSEKDAAIRNYISDNKLIIPPLSMCPNDGKSYSTVNSAGQCVGPSIINTPDTTITFTDAMKVIGQVQNYYNMYKALESGNYGSFAFSAGTAIMQNMKTANGTVYGDLLKTISGPATEFFKNNFPVSDKVAANLGDSAAGAVAAGIGALLGGGSAKDAAKAAAMSFLKLDRICSFGGCGSKWKKKSQWDSCTNESKYYKKKWRPWLDQKVVCKRKTDMPVPNWVKDRGVPSCPIQQVTFDYPNLSQGVSFTVVGESYQFYNPCEKSTFQINFGKQEWYNQSIINKDGTYRGHNCSGSTPSGILFSNTPINVVLGSTVSFDGSSNAAAGVRQKYPILQEGYYYTGYNGELFNKTFYHHNPLWTGEPKNDFYKNKLSYMTYEMVKGEEDSNRKAVDWNNGLILYKRVKCDGEYVNGVGRSWLTKPYDYDYFDDSQNVTEQQQVGIDCKGQAVNKPIRMPKDTDASGNPVDLDKPSKTSAILTLTKFVYSKNPTTGLLKYTETDLSSTNKCVAAFDIDEDLSKVPTPEDIQQAFDVCNINGQESLCNASVFVELANRPENCGGDSCSVATSDASFFRLKNNSEIPSGTNGVNIIRNAHAILLLKKSELDKYLSLINGLKNEINITFYEINNNGHRNYINNTYFGNGNGDGKLWDFMKKIKKAIDGDKLHVRVGENAKSRFNVNSIDDIVYQSLTIVNKFYYKYNFPQSVVKNSNGFSLKEANDTTTLYLFRYRLPVKESDTWCFSNSQIDAAKQTMEGVYNLVNGLKYDQGEDDNSAPNFPSPLCSGQDSYVESQQNGD